jgi:hypothetical protein
MGDSGLSIIYWVLLIYLALFLSLVFLKRNKINKINLFLYIAYSSFYVFFSNNIYFSLYKMILLHFIIALCHVLVSIALNMFFR